MKGVEEVTRRHAGIVAVVSHRVPLKLIVLGLLGLPTKKFWNVHLDTASVTRFEHGASGWVLRSLNDTSHLKPLGMEGEADF